MAINSKQKGKRGELEFVKFLKQCGIEAQRSQQFCGANGDADVVTELDDLHFEVKRTETFSPHKSLAQAQADCNGKTPIVAHRRNRGEWCVFMRAVDLFDLMGVFDAEYT
jgi:Holliday junction resolvase